METNVQKKTYKRHFCPKPINLEILVTNPEIFVLKKYGRFNKAAKEAGFLKHPVPEPGCNFEVYDVTSGGFHADLSPMVLGPVFIDGELFAHNIEDGWQGCKVWSFHMRGHFDAGSPSLWTDDPSSALHTYEEMKWLPEWLKWSKYVRLSGEGKRHRNKSKSNSVNPNVPLGSFYKGQMLGYVEARKQMYIPWYAELILLTDSFQYLKKRFDAGTSLVLLDPDGQPRDERWQVQDQFALQRRVDDISLIFGHGFVLACVLQGIRVW